MFGRSFEFLVAEVLRKLRGFCCHDYGVRGHFHLLPRLTDSHADVDAANTAGIDDHTGINAFLKAGLFGFDAIGTWDQEIDEIISRFLAHRGGNYTCFFVRRANRHSGHIRSGWVMNNARYPAGVDLCKTCGG